MSNTSHDWDNIDLLAIVLDLKVVSNKWVVFIANCHHLFIWTDVKTQRLPVVVPALVGQRHLYWLQVEESNEVVVASSHQEKDFLVRLLLTVSVLDTLVVICCWSFERIPWGWWLSVTFSIHRVLFVEIVYKLLLTLLFLGQVSTTWLIRKPKYLNIIDLPAIKPQHELRIDDLVKLAIVSHTVVVLLVLAFVYLTWCWDHAVVLVMVAQQNLLLVCLTCSFTLFWPIALFKVEVFNNWLHLQD